MIQPPFVPDLYVISRKQEDILLPNMARVMIVYVQTKFDWRREARRKESAYIIICKVSQYCVGRVARNCDQGFWPGPKQNGAA